MQSIRLRTKLLAAALTVSASGLGFIKYHEGESKVVYLDPVGIPTVCVGHTAPNLRVGAEYSSKVCQELLRKDTAVAQKAVQRLVHVPLTQEQYDALVSFTFNVGEGNLAKSTLLKRINAGQCLAAGDEFSRWVYARGQRLKGLERRRTAERAMWVSGC